MTRTWVLIEWLHGRRLWWEMSLREGGWSPRLPRTSQRTNQHQIRIWPIGLPQILYALMLNSLESVLENICFAPGENLLKVCVPHWNSVFCRIMKCQMAFGCPWLWGDFKCTALLGTRNSSTLNNKIAKSKLKLCSYRIVSISNCHILQEDWDTCGPENW